MQVNKVFWTSPELGSLIDEGIFNEFVGKFQNGIGLRRNYFVPNNDLVQRLQHMVHIYIYQNHY